jgi:hypothetical protein
MIADRTLENADFGIPIRGLGSGETHLAVADATGLFGRPRLQQALQHDSVPDLAAMQQLGNTSAGTESRFIFKVSTQRLSRAARKGIALQYAPSTRAMPLPEGSRAA